MRILEDCRVLEGVEVKKEKTSHAVLSHTHPQFIGEQSPMSLWGVPHVEQVRGMELHSTWRLS